MEKIGLAIRDGGISGLEFAGVIASDPIKAKKGIARAHALNMDISVEVSSQERFRGDDGKVDRYGFGQDLLRILKEMGATVVTQNGWLPKTPGNVIEAFSDAIFNQHAGPLPETRNTRGSQPHSIMLYITRHTGRNEGTRVVTHRVVPKMDDGVLVGWSDVPILPSDIPKRLHQRALPYEHRLQINMLNQFVRGDLFETPQEFLFLKHGEEHILDAAVVNARKQYPHG